MVRSPSAELPAMETKPGLSELVAALALADCFIPLVAAIMPLPAVAEYVRENVGRPMFPLAISASSRVPLGRVVEVLAMFGVVGEIHDFFVGVPCRELADKFDLDR